jgi:hypothetical protein
MVTPAGQVLNKVKSKDQTYLNDFRVVEEIGKSEFGKVYKA